MDWNLVPGRGALARGKLMHRWLKARGTAASSEWPPGRRGPGGGGISPTNSPMEEPRVRRLVESPWLSHQVQEIQARTR
eukprot:442977-Hanusia_phi.AAC.1